MNRVSSVAGRRAVRLGVLALGAAMLVYGAWRGEAGTVLSKADGVALAKQGGIRGVAIASRNGSEYLRSIPDGKESNNLGDLPSTGLRGLS